MNAENDTDEYPVEESKENDKHNKTNTQLLQEEAIKLIGDRVMMFYFLRDSVCIPDLEFNTQEHVKYLRSLIKSMGPNNEYLDACGPWVLYWVLNSLTIINIDIDEEFASSVARSLETFRDKDTGAFGGGEYQIPHLGVTYAAICVISMLGESYMEMLIDRQKIFSWINTLIQPDGSIAVHENGEIDLRGSYCAVAVTSLLGLKFDDCDQIGDYIASCQNYEGGLSNVPGSESHAGYTYCGLAALSMLQQEHKIDAELMAKWVTSLQGFAEGGFRGRTNKLVDGCYSFWVGGTIILLMMLLEKNNPNCCVDIFNRELLEAFLLTCCQSETGGFSSSPERPPDLYHTCYCISGLSVLCSFYARCDTYNVVEGQNLIRAQDNKKKENYSTLLRVTHPYYNVRMDFAQRMIAFYTNNNSEETSFSYFAE